MKLSIIRNLAVAALLSTTLISGAMAATIDATDLDLTTGDVGKVLAPLLARPEAATLKVEVEKALHAGTALHSGLAKPALIALIAKYEEGFAKKNKTLRENFFADEGLDLAAIDHLLVGKTAAQIEAEAVDHHWNAFLASDAGIRLAAKKDAEIKFGTAKGSKASDFLAAKPAKLTDAQALAKEAEDYYAHDAALKRNIGEIGALKSSLATSSISVSDVDAILTGLGITVADLGLPTLTDGKVYLKAAFAAIKGEGSAFEAALGKNTATMKQLRLDIAAAGHTPPPPSGSPKGSPLSGKKKAYNAADFNGMPLLSTAEFGAMTDKTEQARLRSIFEGLNPDQKAAYERMAEPTRAEPTGKFATRQDAVNAGLRGADLRNWENFTD